MQRNRKSAKISLFGSLKVMTMAAMLTAMSVVIGIFCKSFLNFGNGLYRVTFENLPILLSGIMFGPVVGGVVGAATDIISYLLSPQTYPINVVVTVGAAAVGSVSGVVSRYIFKKRTNARLILSCLAAHVVGSMIIKPIGLFAFYGWAVLWRVPMYFVIAPIEIVLICAMRRNSTAKKLIDGRSET
jgi:ECF transporter S component (folate family)